jgi:hypothetical protein
MNEAPKLLIFRQKTAKKGQMENGRNGPMPLTYPKNLNGVENHQLRPMADAKWITKIYNLSIIPAIP